MLRRRLTALLVGVLLLPSTAIGGASRCDMRDGAMHGEHVPSAHHGSHPVGETISGIPDERDAPAPLPGEPIECVVIACAGADIGASGILVIDPAVVPARVVAEVTRAPESPAPALDPPPPRA